MSVIGQEFIDDPRITVHVQKLVDILIEYQKKIQGVKAPLSSKKIRYEEIIHAFSLIRGANLYYPYLGSGIGNGSLVELLDGSVKYDMISGIGVHYFGHSHPELAAIAIASGLSDTIMQGNLQQNADSLELSELLTNASGIPHCFLTTSGVMANENALKIALQKNAPATRILAFDHCFAGRTLIFSQVTDKPAFRQGLPLNTPVDYIPYYDADRPEESTKEAIDTLKKILFRYPNSHAMMIFEFVQGEGGFYYGSREFFKAIMDILKEQKIAIFADEIQTFGRTSELFAYQHFDLEQYIDIATIGKLSLSCATFFTEEYQPKPALLSQTFTSSTACIRAGKWIVQKLLDGNFYGANGRVMEIQNRFFNHFIAMQKEFPELIRGPFGIGGMIAFTPFGGAQAKVVAFVQKLFDEGVITFIAGSNPTRVRMLVPVGVITNQEIDEVMEIIKKTLIQF